MPFYFTFDQAWLALGISSADSMSKYLSHSILINVTGYLIFIMTAFLVELQNKNIVSEDEYNEALKQIEELKKQLNHTVIDK